MSNVRLPKVDDAVHARHTTAADLTMCGHPIKRYGRHTATATEDAVDCLECQVTERLKMARALLWRISPSALARETGRS